MSICRHYAANIVLHKSDEQEKMQHQECRAQKEDYLHHGIYFQSDIPWRDHRDWLYDIWQQYCREKCFKDVLTICNSLYNLAYSLPLHFMQIKFYDEELAGGR